MDVDSHKHTTDAASHHHCDDVTLVSHHLAVHDDVIRLKLWIYICGYIYGYRQPQPYRRWCGQPLEACVRAETARQSTTASEFHMSHHHTTCHIIKLCHVIKIRPYDRAETLHTAYAAPHHRTVSNHHMCHIIILCHHMCHIIILCHLVGKDDSTIVDNSLKALAARCLVVGVLRLVVPLCVCARVTSSYYVTSSTTNINVSWL